MAEGDVLARTLHATSPLDLAIAAWLHAKQQKSQSRKTLAAYSSILQAFRDRLQAQGTDLDVADPRTLPAEESAREALIAERLTMLALSAQAFAAQPSATVMGTRPIAAVTANLRLAVLSSFYTYALRQGLLQGTNPILRVERHKVQAYAHARPISYDVLAEHLNAIDMRTPMGLRDYALLVLGLIPGDASPNWPPCVGRMSSCGKAGSRLRGHGARAAK